MSAPLVLQTTVRCDSACLGSFVSLPIPPALPQGVYCGGFSLNLQEKPLDHLNLGAVATVQHDKCYCRILLKEHRYPSSFLAYGPRKAPCLKLLVQLQDAYGPVSKLFVVSRGARTFCPPWLCEAAGLQIGSASHSRKTLLPYTKPQQPLAPLGEPHIHHEWISAGLTNLEAFGWAATLQRMRRQHSFAWRACGICGACRACDSSGSSPGIPHRLVRVSCADRRRVKIPDSPSLASSPESCVGF